MVGAANELPPKTSGGRRMSKLQLYKADLIKNRYIYLMAIPVLAYYLIFCYYPIYGAQIAFKDFAPGKGIWGSPWAGFKHFENFFTSMYFGRTLRNTLMISLETLIFVFPSAIILALLLNELRCKAFKSFVQTVSYLPHFISIVVICSMIRDFTSSTGVISKLISRLTGSPAQSLLLFPKNFRAIYIISQIWQTIGWNSIIYMAAIAGIDPNLYDAAVVDGAGRFRRMLNVTLPSLAPTITILFILQVGKMMNVGYEKIILLYNSNIYETADVISTYVYRKGLLELNYSYSTAVGLFNSVVNFALVAAANYFSGKINETSLW